MSNKAHTSLSIITVTAFDIPRLTLTMNSLIGTEKFAELVVIYPNQDEDTTLFLNHFVQKHNINIVIGHDDNLGIYQAMNIGAKLSNGNYIVYWNSGDLCASRENLFEFIQNLQTIKPAWGVFQGKFSWRISQELTEKNLRSFCLHRGGYLSHQTVFVSKKNFLSFGGFDETYTIAADAKIITQFWLKYKCLFLNLPIVNIEFPNYSAKNHRRGRIENLRLASETLSGLNKSIAFVNILASEIAFANRKIISILKKRLDILKSR